MPSLDATHERSPYGGYVARGDNLRLLATLQYLIGLSFAAYLFVVNILASSVGVAFPVLFWILAVVYLVSSCAAIIIGYSCWRFCSAPPATKTEIIIYLVTNVVSFCVGVGAIMHFLAECAMSGCAVTSLPTFVFFYPIFELLVIAFAGKSYLEHGAESTQKGDVELASVP